MEATFTCCISPIAKRDPGAKAKSNRLKTNLTIDYAKNEQEQKRKKGSKSSKSQSFIYEKNSNIFFNLLSPVLGIVLILYFNLLFTCSKNLEGA